MMGPKVPGSNTYPAYTMKCENCSHEFTKRIAKEAVKESTCPVCENRRIVVMYVSFPSDGPGFQEEYTLAGLVNGYQTKEPEISNFDKGCAYCSDDFCSS